MVACTQELAAQRSQEIHLDFLGEQHGKGLLDAMFGVASDKGEGWVAKYARSHNIFTIDDLVTALQHGAKHAAGFAANNATWVIKKLSFSDPKPAKQEFFYAKSLKLTRTYSLEIVPRPPPNRAGARPQVHNCIFTGGARIPVTDWRLEVMHSDGDENWRRTYLEGPRDWEEGPPTLAKADSHHLVRVWEAQHRCRAPHGMFYHRTLAQKVARVERRHLRNSRRLQNKLQYLRQAAIGEDAQSGSSTSTSSSST